MDQHGDRERGQSGKEQWRQERHQPYLVRDSRSRIAM
jgi:hypothetical protein